MHALPAVEGGDDPLQDVVEGVDVEPDAHAHAHRQDGHRAPGSFKRHTQPRSDVPA